MSRLIIVSNRLPFSVDKEGDQVKVRQSSGGLVSALKGYFESSHASDENITEKMWIGVADFSQEDWEKTVSKQAGQEGFRIVPLFVEEQLYKNYYNGFSNSVVWPLFHYFSSLAEYKTHYFDGYIQVNKLFSELLLPILKPGDIIWIHDYQLMLLPRLLRAKSQDLTIGFFLHIPFPSYEIFRLLPSEWKKTILRGILGADLIGFHTHDYVQHFIQSVKMILAVDNYFHSLYYENRLIKIDLFPIGIEYKKFNQVIQNKEVVEKQLEMKKSFPEKRIVFSVDRLDYTKGMMYRLTGIEYFLDQYPQWRDKVVFILNVVPSRHTITAYLERKRMIEEKVGTINGKFSTIAWQPIVYRYNHLQFNELLGLYLAADAALITPLRDGMNLVAKEFVAARSDEQGVLILSELAGAASELNEALLVNPTDVVDFSSAIDRALNMPAAEQRSRLLLMQKRLQDYDVVRWVNDFLEQLSQVKREQQKMKVKVLDEKVIETLRKKYIAANKRCLLLDYDGTLVPFSRTPSQAVPTPEVKELIGKLAALPNNHLVIISGRDAHTIEKWLGDLPITLVAEHGASYKLKGEQWQQLLSMSDMWKDEVRPLLQKFVTRCAGSFIEEKVNTIAWHYRNTIPDLGFIRSRELLNNLSQLIQNTTLQVIDGNKVIEVRISGLDKGSIALKILNDMSPDFVLCMGDDTTDEDMFKALEGRAYTLKVGYGATTAKYTMLSQTQVLPLLSKFLTPANQTKYAGT